MEIEKTSRFNKSVKKLRANERAIVDEAVEAITNDLSIGKALKGHLVVGLLTYRPKKMQQFRLIYTYDEQSDTLSFVEFGNRDKIYEKLSRNPYKNTN